MKGGRLGVRGPGIAREGISGMRGPGCVSVGERGREGVMVSVRGPGLVSAVGLGPQWTGVCRA